MKYPKRVTIIELENAPFRCAKGAGVAARGQDETLARKWGVAQFTRGSRRMSPKAKDNQPTKVYSYEISNIEVLKGNAGDVPLPSDKTSMDVGILLNGVCDVNGVPLVKI